MRGLYLASIVALAVAASGPAAQAAQAAQCVTRDQAQALIGYMLPIAATAARSTCASHLAPGGYMAGDMAGLISRFQADRAGFWPGAKAAFIKLAGESGAMMAGLPDEALQPLIDAFLPTALSDAIKPKDCGTIEAAAALLAPLPSGNIASLVGLVLAEQRKDTAVEGARTENGRSGGGRRGMNFTICPQ